MGLCMDQHSTVQHKLTIVVKTRVQAGACVDFHVNISLLLELELLTTIIAGMF